MYAWGVDAHRQGDGPETRCGLGWPERWIAVADRGELAVDPELAAQEVDAVDAEPEALALAEADARRSARRTAPGWW